MHDRMVAGTELAVMGEKIVELVPVQPMDDGIGIRGPARVWDAKTGATLVVLSGDTDWVLRAEFTQDGSRVFTRSRDQSVRLWDANTGAQLVKLDVPGNLLSAALRKDASYVVTGSSDHFVRKPAPSCAPCQGIPAWLPSYR
jgi:WD40 repeat protein